MSNNITVITHIGESVRVESDLKPCKKVKLSDDLTKAMIEELIRNERKRRDSKVRNPDQETYRKG